MDIGQIEAAAARLHGKVRRTPTLLWAPRPSLQGVPDSARIYLKLEQLQVGGSFKLRGAMNLILQTPTERLTRGVYTASGGNHGIGVAYAARLRGASARVFLPDSAPPRSEEALLKLGAQVVRGGAAWDDAWERASEEAAQTGALLVHPFDDDQIIAGQGTIGLEICADVPDVDRVLVAVGGGGVLGGVATAVAGRTSGRARGPVQIIGVEPTGADKLFRSLAEGALVRLEQVRTIAGSLAPRAVSARTLALASALIAEVVLVSDDEMQAAQRLAWDDLRLTLEPAGAATLAALCAGKLGPGPVRGDEAICLLLCGANI